MDEITCKEALYLVLNGGYSCNLYKYKLHKWKNAINKNHWRLLQRVITPYPYYALLERKQVIMLNNSPTYYIQVRSYQLNTNNLISINQSNCSFQYAEYWIQNYVNYNQVTYNK